MDDPQEHVDTASQYRDHAGPMVVVKYYAPGNRYLGRLRIPKGASWFDHEGKRFYKRQGTDDIFDQGGVEAPEDEDTNPLEDRTTTSLEASSFDTPDDDAGTKGP